MMIMMAVTEVLTMSDDRLDNTENVIMGINMNNDDDWENLRKLRVTMAMMEMTTVQAAKLMVL